jgi:hypothetical protein
VEEVDFVVEKEGLVEVEMHPRMVAGKYKTKNLQSQKAKNKTNK